MRSAYLLPLAAMVLLNFLVWLRLYQTRLGEMKRRRIHPQAVASASQMAALEDTRAADNFRNLSELPVLFYAAMLLILLLPMHGTLLLVLSWCFVALRYLHSFIHCTYNRVKDRFAAYLLSSIALWALWAVLLFDRLR